MFKLRKVRSKLPKIFKAELNIRRVSSNKVYTMTQLAEEIGEYAGVPAGYILTLVNQGNANIKLPIAIQISEYFRMSVNDMWEVIDEEIESVTCDEENCDKPTYRGTKCQKHYSKKKQNKEEIV